MKINLVNLAPNRTYKSLSKKNPAHTSSNQKDFSISQNILSNYSKAMISFSGKVNEDELREYILQNPDKNQAEIAQHFGVNQGAISLAIKKYKIAYSDKTKPPLFSNEELKNYIAQNPNANLVQIAEHFGVEDSTISRAIIDHKIDYSKKYPAPSITKGELKSYIMTHPKATLREIAENFNSSTATIYKLINIHGIEYKSKKQYSIPKEELENYIKANPNADLKEIAKHFNVTSMTISRSIKHYGIEYTRKKPGTRKK